MEKEVYINPGSATAKLMKIWKNDLEKLEEEEKLAAEETKFVGLKLTSYYDNVKLFHQKQPFFYDKTGLFWFWNSNEFKWEILDEVDVMSKIDEGLQFGGETVTGSVKNSYLEAFKRVGRLNIPKDTKSHYLQFKDKVINILTSEEYKATPVYFFTNPIPYEIGLQLETPVMDSIFTEWVGSDNVPLLYEIIAYSLLPDYPLNRIFCFLGSGMNGKSKFLDLIKRFVGNNNYCSTELETLMQSRFEITKLHKKLVCFMGETDFGEMKRTSILKKLSGGDVIGFEYKNKNPFDDVNYAKLLIATNNLPSTTDKTIGFYRRWVIIDFPNKFSEKKDILADIPEEEYNNLACKCISILRKLLIEREFTNEGTIEERMKRFEDRSNPLKHFLEENTVEDCEGIIFKHELRKRLDDWCVENNFRKITETELGKNMKKHFRSVRRTADWFSKEGVKPQLRAWEGLRWQNP